MVEWNAWEQARNVAARVLSGAVLRDVGSATHFHTSTVDPEWGSRMLRVAQVGLHVFYRLNPHAPPPPGLDEADDDAPQLVSRPQTAPVQLRLAAAVVAPSADADAKPAGAPVASAEIKLAPKPAEPAAPLAKTDAPAPAKPDTATPS